MRKKHSGKITTNASDPTSNMPNVVEMLERWHQYITSWVFGRVFGTMSRDGAEFDPNLWTDAALSSSPQWDDIRRLAAAALELFPGHTSIPSLEESGA